MDIIIVSDSVIPLYEQIVTQIKGAILTQQLVPGEAMPSIRLMAKDLKVSIITVKRAYEELEREGFAKTIQGKGTYVALANIERLREARISQLEEKLGEIVIAAKMIGLTVEDIKSRVEMIYEEE